MITPYTYYNEAEIEDDLPEVGMTLLQFLTGMITLLLVTMHAADAKQFLDLGATSAKKSASASPSLSVLNSRCSLDNSPDLDFNLPKFPCFEKVISAFKSAHLNAFWGNETPTQAFSKLTGLDLSELFSGGSYSLVAKAVGSAEGTRTPEGGKTLAYEGHVDPGNGVWNLGTFSYQHQASSPEEADEKQLQRLKRQAEALRQKARERNLELTPEEVLNGIDLANQAPLAALDEGGYLDRLKEAREQGKQGAEAVIWARTHAFWDPEIQNWDAPGLGNTHQRISQDQERRFHAIARALEWYQKNQNPTQTHLLATTDLSADRASRSVPTSQAPVTPPPPEVQIESASLVAQKPEIESKPPVVPKPKAPTAASASDLTNRKPSLLEQQAAAVSDTTTSQPSQLSQPSQPSQFPQPPTASAVSRPISQPTPPPPNPSPAETDQKAASEAAADRIIFQDLDHPDSDHPSAQELKVSKRSSQESNPASGVDLNRGLSQE